MYTGSKMLPSSSRQIKDMRYNSNLNGKFTGILTPGLGPEAPQDKGRLMRNLLSLEKLRFQLRDWLILTIAFLAIQTLTLLSINHASARPIEYFIDFLLLLSATCLALVNAARSQQNIRTFWSFLAVSYALWAVNVLNWVFSVAISGKVPGLLIGATPLFLHTVFTIGAFAALPHLVPPREAPNRKTLNFLLLLFFWFFLYSFWLLPHKDLPLYALLVPWLLFYMLENILLLAVQGVAIYRARNAWKTIYWHFLGASALYVLSSLTFTLFFRSTGNVNAWVDLLINASIFWFVSVTLLGRNLATELVESSVSQRGILGYPSTFASLSAMLTVVAIPLLGVWELFRVNEPERARSFRLLIVLVSGVSLAVVLVTREYLANRQLASEVGSVNERLRLAMQSSRSVEWYWDVKSGQNSWSGDLKALFGIPRPHLEGCFTDFLERLHPDDRESVGKAITMAVQNREPLAAEFRLLWADGTVLWVGATGRFHYGVDGSPERMLGVVVDITDRKRAEEALSDMTRKLVYGQEQERTRIARELHDDVNQRLALVTAALGQLQDNPSEVQARLEELRKETREISNEVHALSHDLHSSQLDYLGVVAGIKSWCREFAERQKMEIDYRHDVRSTLTTEIGLCLFRVLQEALHNAAKHSVVKRVDVQLREESGEIHLIVRDCGRGFDVEAVKRGNGLGLTSMRERVRLINGTIAIDSKPMGGTTVHVRVPLTMTPSKQVAV